MAKNYRILALTRYSQLGASSRIRFYSYKDLMSQHGFNIYYQALLPDLYVENLYGRKKTSLWILFYYYLRRFFFLLFKAWKYDLVWLEKELFPGLPTFVEKIFFIILPPYIADYDDSIHLNYRGKSLGRKNKIEKIMKGAVKVLAGSPYLGEVAKNSQAKVRRVPTPVHLISPTYRASQRFCVGWVGSPSTEVYLLDKKNLFQKLSKIMNIDFVFIGAQSSQWSEMPNVKLIPWSEENEKNGLNQFDVGIMPLRDTPWEEGKCSYKLLLYMSAGRPVVASNVGMNKEVVVHGSNGYLVNSDKEWVESLQKLAAMNLTEREAMGRISWEIVREKYTYDKTTMMIVDTFKDVLGIS